MTGCKEIQDYIDLVRSRPYEICEEQFQLCNLVEEIFKTESIQVNEEQLKKYLAFQKYFPYSLFEWELFCFALHNCTYRTDGLPRFPVLVLYVGRGTGKNGYLSFEDFCLLTPVNGIKHYNIDIFAMSEKQAKMSFQDVYEVLEDNKAKMKNHFYWTKEVIKNRKTRSELAYNTSAPKTKDGFRPGKVDFDEYHAYEDMKLVDVAVTGLGKIDQPKQTIITTDGNVRDGPLDTLLSKCHQILNREIPDNGTLPFLCRIKDKEQVKDKKYWPAANPSLPYRPTLQQELEIELTDYLMDPIGHAAFSTKRMNCPAGDADAEVTSWANIQATNRPIPDLEGNFCVGGIDYASTQDFVAAGLLFIVDGWHYWISHQWVCKYSKDIPRIKYDIRAAAERGLLTIVDDIEISPEIPAEWLVRQEAKYRILQIGIDKFRFTLLSKALKEAGFVPEGKTQKGILLTRPSDEMIIQPTISSLFTQKKIIWDDNSLMRWNTQNSKIITSAAGNVTYGKIEPKSRKTDGFKAFVAAEISANNVQLEEYKKIDPKSMNLGVWTY